MYNIIKIILLLLLGKQSICMWFVNVIQSIYTDGGQMHIILC